MPYRFEFDVEQKILLIVMEGEIQTREVEDFNYLVGKYVRELEPDGAIADLSSVTKFQVAGEIIRAAAAHPSAFPAETPRYLVAPTDYLFGLARMYQLAADRPKDKLKVVRTMQEALAGLGVKSPKFAPLP